MKKIYYADDSLCNLDGKINKLNSVISFKDFNARNILQCSLGAPSTILSIKDTQLISFYIQVIPNIKY